MKAISIRSPWWLAILEWGKPVENRFWSAPLDYRGPLLLHASAWWDVEQVITDVRLVQGMRREGLIPPCPPRKMQHIMDRRGGIVGRVQLVDCRWNRDSGNPWAVDASPELPPRFSKTGALGLWLADPAPLPFAPLKGALGLFDVTRESVLSDPRRAKDTDEHRAAVERLLEVLAA